LDIATETVVNRDCSEKTCNLLKANSNHVIF
jgi:hypothetical protein